MDRSPNTNSQSPSMSIVTAQMASVSMFNTDYRKQAFASHNHSSWPTPPTELDHDFPQDSCEDMDKMITLPPLQQDTAGIQSPPASPGHWSNKLPPLQPAPESPAQEPLPSISTELRQYSPGQEPLFPSPQASPAERVDQVSSSSPSADLGIYKIFPQFKGADREYFRKYRDARYAELSMIPGWRPINRTLSPVQPEVLAPRRLPASPRQKPVEPIRPQVATTRVTKPAHRPKVAKLNTTSPVSRPAKTPIKTRERNSASVEPQARKRAAPTKPVVQDNWQDLQDYAPPVSTLDSMSTKLHVVWRGSPNDLSNDPEVKHLHKQEVEIAESLKLPANQYLANKRRIFEARLKSIRERKNFTKTAAQQACNIDVNKTSQLYEAYERVGWFDESNFKQWLV